MIPISLIKQTFSPSDGNLSMLSSRRKRLWELPWHIHCPVIGVCLPLQRLRRIAAKVAPELNGCDDYALHSAAVQLARQRNKLSEALNGELNQCYAVVIRSLRREHDCNKLSTCWKASVGFGELSGALWAIVTHPACDANLTESLSQQLHMIQHQAGASLRVDINRFHALQDENSVLANALACTQRRCERVVREKITAIDYLRSELLRLRAALISKDTELESLRTELQADKSTCCQSPMTDRLAQQLAYQEERCARLTLENARLSKALAKGAAISPSVLSSRLAKASADITVEGTPLAEVALNGHRILCVGGRESAVVTYRKLIEQAGGKFFHHDGGLEDRFGQLDSALGSADLVICQTGCISHNAYWRVKDHCKRTGKRCAFVETPSAAGLARGLHELLTDVPE
jgi:hypothetical protein